MFTRCDTQFIRTDNSRRRCPQRGCRIGGNIRLHFAQFCLPDNTQIGNTVSNPARKELFKMRNFLIGIRTDKRAALGKRNVELFCFPGHHGTPRHIQPRFQCSFFCVKPCVNNRRICLGCTHGNIARRFQHCSRNVVSGEFSCRHRTGNTGTDNTYIVIHK